MKRYVLLLLSVYQLWGSADPAKLAPRPAKIWERTGLLPDIQKIIIGYLDRWELIDRFRVNPNDKATREFKIIRSASHIEFSYDHTTQSQGVNAAEAQLIDQIINQSERTIVVSPKRQYAIIGSKDTLTGCDFALKGKFFIFDLVNRALLTSIDNVLNQLILPELRAYTGKSDMMIDGERYTLSRTDSGYLIFSILCTIDAVPQNQAHVKRINLLYDFINKKTDLVTANARITISPNQRFVAFFYKDSVSLFDAVDRKMSCELDGISKRLGAAAKIHHNSELFVHRTSIAPAVLDTGDIAFAFIIQTIAGLNHAQIFASYDLTQQKIMAVVPLPIKDLRVIFLLDLADFGLMLFIPKLRETDTDSELMFVNSKTKIMQPFSSLSWIDQLRYVESHKGRCLAITGRGKKPALSPCSESVTEIWRNEAEILQHAMVQESSDTN